MAATVVIPRCRRLQDYVDAVSRAGGEPLVVDVRRPAGAALDDAHALLLPGGDDVDPALYGEAPHPTYTAAEQGRDAFELELVRAALARDYPVLAICRGIQVLNVARGGTLIQDIPAEVAGACEHQVRDAPTAYAHPIRVTAESRLAGLLQDRLASGACDVNSRHHQAVGRIGSGLTVAAVAPDGVIEAVEDRSRRFCIGVQWHPENFHRSGEFAALFDGLIRAAQRD